MRKWCPEWRSVAACCSMLQHDHTDSHGDFEIFRISHTVWCLCPRSLRWWCSCSETTSLCGPAPSLSWWILVAWIILNWQYKTIQNYTKLATCHNCFGNLSKASFMPFPPFHPPSFICEVSFRVLSFAGHQIPADDSTCFTAVLSLDALASYLRSPYNEDQWRVLHHTTY